MDRKLQDHWSELIRPLFRHDADFKVQNFEKVKNFEKDFEVEVSWKLGIDPSRPSKRSKKIRIIIPFDTVDDYQNKSRRQQENDDRKLIQFIKLNIQNFEPDHDNPTGMEPPEVKWIAGSNVLNS